MQDALAVGKRTLRYEIFFLLRGDGDNSLSSLKTIRFSLDSLSYTNPLTDQSNNRNTYHGRSRRFNLKTLCILISNIKAIEESDLDETHFEMENAKEFVKYLLNYKEIIDGGCDRYVVGEPEEEESETNEPFETIGTSEYPKAEVLNYSYYTQ
ncbi:hypothetical protein H8356DRAFT_1344768 [Neocallimastix lanati (nom. inval.)]|nr:hypothetical protein H8356DRAFT_1344768 [Neocallimastix sp. JGI-2020a]